MHYQTKERFCRIMGRGRQAGWKGTLRHPVFFPMQVSNAPQLTIRSLKSGGREGGGGGWGGNHVAASQQSTFSRQIRDEKSRGGKGRQTERQSDRAVGGGAQQILK